MQYYAHSNAAGPEDNSQSDAPDQQLTIALPRAHTNIQKCNDSNPFHRHIDLD
jgi:hypothetical protein